MNNRGLALTIFLTIGLLAGCGGGASGLASVASEPGGGGIGGSGVTSSGTVTGFGSVFVNGVEFETDEAEITVNGLRVGEEALGLGMVVTVRGTVNDDGLTGHADTVVFDGALQGPIDSITRGAHGDVLLLGVLGIEVTVERSATVFEGVEFAGLRLNDLVEVSGYRDSEGRLQSTRVERLSDFVPNESEVDRAGLVTGLNGTEFMLGGFSVDFGTADLSVLPGGVIEQGQQVLVSGTLSGARITASVIRLVPDVSRDLVDNEDVVLQGSITDFDNLGRFEVRGVAIDARDAMLELAGEELNRGLIVQITGVWNGESLVARSVISRQARIVIAAPVSSVNMGAGTVSLQLYDSTLTFVVSSETLIEDSTEQRDRLRLSDISRGDYLVIEALVRGSTRLALRVNRSELDDSVLRAALESIDSETQLTLQGITIDTLGAEFVIGDGVVVGADVFFGQLELGDLLRVTDSQVTDGMVDEVRIVPSDIAPVAR